MTTEEWLKQQDERRAKDPDFLELRQKAMEKNSPGYQDKIRKGIKDFRKETGLNFSKKMVAMNGALNKKKK